MPVTVPVTVKSVTLIVVLVRLVRLRIVDGTMSHATPLNFQVLAPTVSSAFNAGLLGKFIAIINI
jgi:hypothetical protein